jgi:Cu+-exporting ATPase
MRPLTWLPFLLLLFALPVLADNGTAPDLAAAAQAAGTANGLCPVMHNPVKASGGNVLYRGEKIGFCCPGCARKFLAEPAWYMDVMRANPARFGYTSHLGTKAQLEQKAAEAGTANGVCPVMHRPVTKAGGFAIYKTQRIGFCCPGCKAKFEAAPEKFMRDLRADPGAYAYDRPGPSNFAMHTARANAGTVNGRCPVMGGLVQKDAGSVVYGGEKIGFCCPACIQKFKADPERYMAPLRSEPGPNGYVPAKGR